MAEFKNLLETMSSVFNKTTTDKTSSVDLNDDKTLKWKTLHHNQYASKKEGKKTRCLRKNKNNRILTENDAVTKGQISEEDHSECGNSDSSENGPFIRTRKRVKESKSAKVQKDNIYKSFKVSKRKRSHFDSTSVLDKQIKSISTTNTVQKNITNSNNKSTSDQIISSAEEVFRSFGQTIAFQLKELNKFSKIEAHKTMQDVQNLVATRIVKILAQEEKRNT